MPEKVVIAPNNNAMIPLSTIVFHIVIVLYFIHLDFTNYYFKLDLIKQYNIFLHKSTNF